MTKAILPDGRQATYKYDAFGRRIKKTITDKNGHQKTTEFLWQGDNLIAETDNKEHYQGYIYEPNSFKPLALIVGRGKEHKVYHYQLDHIGTPLDLTNTEGKAVWSAQYLAYGTIYTQHTEEVTNPLRFQGQYFDQETGLHYNRYRYYNPKSGLFTTADPIGLAGGLNNYQYVKNPTGFVDPLGLADVPMGGGCGGRGRSQNLTRAEKDNITTLRTPHDEVFVDDINQARRLLDNMPELKPATQDRLIPNPSGGLANGFKDPKGTYRGDLINKSNPSEAIHPRVLNPNHANYPHFNITLLDGNKSAIIIKSN